MKKILTAIVMIVFVSATAHAQKAKKPAVTPAAGKPTAKKHARHKKQEVPQNFQICRYNGGYVICDQAPAKHNATHPGMVIKDEEKHWPSTNYVDHHRWPARPSGKKDGAGPEGQSYPENIYTVYGVGENPYQDHNHIQLGPFDNAQ